MKLTSVQILRAVAANAVVMSHITAFERAYAGPDRYLQSWYYGAAGVDLFFVISGFLMVAIASDETPLSFLWKRFSRIYPTYWVATAAFLWFSSYYPGLIEPRLPESESTLRTVFLIPIWGDNIIPIAWTLIFEVWFYLVFALVLALRANIWKAMAAWVAVLSFLLARGSPFHIPLYHTSSFLGVEFIMGMFAGMLWKRGVSRFALPALVIGVGLMAVSVFYWAPTFNIGKLLTYQNWRVLFFGVPAVLILYGSIGLEQYARRLPRILVALGNASYSTYLFHLIVLFVVSDLVRRSGWFSGWMDNTAIVVLGLAASNAVAYLIYRCFERPIMSISRIIESATKRAIDAGPIRLPSQQPPAASDNNHI
ncbi:acyltransferase [Rhizobium lentis]|uniref:acyltransferase family protein n=1 Tax=Rhizobium lentis TaxID=1138194 RepID=UPI001C82CCEF|nr:acyltransferase [Rhizobium lentis]MBX5143219.1 acyltransferase [Rhizobium lentis]